MDDTVKKMRLALLIATTLLLACGRGASSPPAVTEARDASVPAPTGTTTVDTAVPAEETPPPTATTSEPKAPGAASTIPNTPPELPPQHAP